jgi:short-subunit dehydrogenase
VTEDKRASVGKDMPMRGWTALITGASSGIGAAAARRLSRAGLRVVLVARRKERLEQIAAEINQSGGEAHVISADLELPDSPQAVYDQVTASLGGVDVLVNNAGLGWYGYYSEMPLAIAREMVAVNIAAVTELTRLFLPGMRTRRRGHVINISSIAGSMPNQGIAIYSATKAFIDAFTTVLHRELQGSPVHASVVRPGPVKTEFFPTAAGREAGSPVPAEHFAVSAEVVAESIWSLLRRPRRVVYVPWALSLSPWVEILFSRIIDRLGPLLLRKSVRGSR